MAFNFPNAPSANQIYTAPNGLIYQYVAPVWNLLGASVITSAVIISDTAPVSPLPSQLWWEATTGSLFIYYNDGDTSQWVQVNGTSG